MRSSVYSGMGKTPPPGLGRSHRRHVIFTIPRCNTDSYSGSVISALLRAGVLDPNCLPRHNTRPREFAYHSTLFALRQRSRRQPCAGPVCVFVGVDIRSDGPATRFTSPRSRLSDVMQVRLSGAWCDAAQRRRRGLRRILPASWIRYRDGEIG